MSGEKQEERREPVVQLPEVFIPSLYISGLNMPQCEQYLVNKTRFSIGSGEENDCVINYPSLGLSRKHCVIEYDGQIYTIEHSPIRGNTRLDKKNHILYVSGGIEFLHRRVKDSIKKLALEEFTRRSNIVADKIGKRVHNVCIKDTKSRWASCSTLNNINYSWRLALAPDFVIRYIVAHEVSHLKHQDHSAYFWALVEYLEDDAEKGRDWLTENGHLLYIYK